MKKILRSSFQLLAFAFCLIACERLSAAPGANLNQARNGTALAPTNPMQWVNGNLNTGNAHYIEGMSAPYQCIMTELPVGTQINITFGYDVKNSSKNAFDYLTHYNRITPHGFGVHSAPEGINPLTGTGLPANTPYMTYPIPAPSSAGSTVPGQPGTSFNSIPAGERVMTIYNGTIDTIYYAVHGNLTASAAETRIVIVFRPAAATSVLTWGGHIGSRNDWGFTAGVPNSA